MATMKLVLLLSCLAIVQADETQDDVIINGVRHQKEILYDNQGGPKRMTVDYKGNILYFNYKRDHVLRAGKIDLKTKVFEEIEGDFYHGTAVDQETQDVYLGGVSGIRKYNVSTNKAELIGDTIAAPNVWNMFFKKVLYYIPLHPQFVHTFTNGHYTKFEEVNRQVQHFVIDSKDVMYFSYRYFFYLQKKGTNDTRLIEDVPYVTALNIDNNGDVYSCSFDGIYKAVGHSTKFIKILDATRLHSIAFDRDNNLIYSDDEKIIRLKPVTSVRSH